MKLFVVANEVGIYVFDNMDSANNFNQKVGVSSEMITEIFPDCQTALKAYRERKAMVEAFLEGEKERCPECCGTNVVPCDGRYDFHCYDCGNEYD